VLKFHYLAQLLFDSNCLLLVLKMFGLTDLSAAIQPKNESDWRYVVFSPDQTADTDRVQLVPILSYQLLEIASAG
jgi:hypothetical protein